MNVLFVQEIIFITRTSIEKAWFVHSARNRSRKSFKDDSNTHTAVMLGSIFVAYHTIGFTNTVVLGTNTDGLVIS